MFCFVKREFCQTFLNYFFLRWNRLWNKWAQKAAAKFSIGWAWPSSAQLVIICMTFIKLVSVEWMIYCKPCGGFHLLLYFFIDCLCLNCKFDRITFSIQFVFIGSMNEYSASSERHSGVFKQMWWIVKTNLLCKINI